MRCVKYRKLKNMEEEDIFEKSYKRAIKGREHHYNNFNYWTNFYAIVIGALFVGYYKITDDMFLRGIVAFLGFATTFAWLQSFRGYYHWIKQWINVVMFHEEKYIDSVKESKNTMDEEEKNNLRVYTLYSESEKEYSCCPLKSRNISTQKMTLRLIFLLMMGWLFLLGYTIYPKFNDLLQSLIPGAQCRCLFTILLLVVIVGLIICLFVCESSSDVSRHYRLKKEKNKYKVYPPKN